VGRHFIKKKIEDSSIELPFVKSKDQLTNILTKAVTGRVLTCVLNKLSIALVISLLTLRGSVRILLSDKQISRISEIIKLSENISKNIRDNEGSIREYQ